MNLSFKRSRAGEGKLKLESEQRHHQSSVTAFRGFIIYIKMQIARRIFLERIAAVCRLLEGQVSAGG